jgi:hypothetical protein
MPRSGQNYIWIVEYLRNDSTSLRAVYHIWLNIRVVYKIGVFAEKYE